MDAQAKEIKNKVIPILRLLPFSFFLFEFEE
jgi:hypothetical protein